MKDLTQSSYVDNKGKTLNTKIYWYGLYGSSMNMYDRLTVSIGLYQPVTPLTYTNIRNELQNNGGIVFGYGSFNSNAGVSGNYFFNQYTIANNQINIIITSDIQGSLKESTVSIDPSGTNYSSLRIKALYT